MVNFIPTVALPLSWGWLYNIFLSPNLPHMKIKSKFYIYAWQPGRVHHSWQMASIISHFTKAKYNIQTKLLSN
jgi:hypothetical protein